VPVKAGQLTLDTVSRRHKPWRQSACNYGLPEQSPGIVAQAEFAARHLLLFIRRLSDHSPVEKANASRFGLSDVSTLRRVPETDEAGGGTRLIGRIEERTREKREAIEK
jgi:hypothetical protein